MTSTKEEALFTLALEKRAAFLDAMCEGDAALRQRLDAWLAAHEQPATELVTGGSGLGEGQLGGRDPQE